MLSDKKVRREQKANMNQNLIESQVSRWKKMRVSDPVMWMTQAGEWKDGMVVMGDLDGLRFK